MARATGIGGVFSRSPDPAATVEWYRTHLGLDPEVGHPSVTFSSSGGETSVWAPFDADTDYFGRAEQPFMINFRVDDLDGLLASFRDAGVEVMDDTEDSEYGRFGWVLGGDGRRIELWQPPAGR